MKNGLLRFYLIFLLMSLVLFSCENNQISQDTTTESPSLIERKPIERHPVEPNEAPADSQKSKKSPRKYVSKLSNWC